jgi:hypothetical protein
MLTLYGFQQSQVLEKLIMILNQYQPLADLQYLNSIL